ELLNKLEIAETTAKNSEREAVAAANGTFGGDGIAVCNYAADCWKAVAVLTQLALKVRDQL
ncbi:MAG: hypothetical protein MN733_07700, partial [Nitrososphaera sp.]|nr:hypothetical protein [Nitrososphaera sp.]